MNNVAMNLMDVPEGDWVLEAFEASEALANGIAHTPLHALRRRAFSRFREMGFPTAQQEEWKYTNPRPIVEGHYRLGIPETPNGISWSALETQNVFGMDVIQQVFVDGRFSPELSAAFSSNTPHEGIELFRLSEIFSLYMHDAQTVVAGHLGRAATIDEHPFAALNTALFQDAMIVRIQDGVQADRPIRIVFVSTGSSASSVSFPRVLVIAGKNSRSTVIESYFSLGTEKSLTNSVSEIYTGEGAKVDHYRIQDESHAAYHVSRVAGKVARSSSLSTFALTLGGAIVRNELDIVLSGEGASARLNGLTVLNETQHVDNHTLLDHAVPHCESHELYKGIYADKSRGVFSGTIVVRPDAQKTNAIQHNSSMLLSDTARSDSRPQLKIWADDVKCTHGATVGQIDEKALFYLRSRGISESEARKLLVKAFAGEVLQHVDGRLRDYFTMSLERRLN